MMFRLILLLVIAIACTSAYGTSIFDDPDPAPAKNAPSPNPPSTPTPPPANAPAAMPPANKPADQASTPKKNPAPPPAAQDYPVPPDISAGSHGQPAPQESAEAKAAREKAAVDAEKKELASAQEALRQAEKAADQNMEKDHSYVTAREHARVAMNAGDFNSPFVEEANNLRQALLEKDTAYQDAKQRVATVTREIAVMSGLAPPEDPKVVEDMKRNIADAIARHDFIKGMSFIEACRSARIPFDLVSTEGNRKIYHWNIKGQTGTTQVTMQDARGRPYKAAQATYGVVAYVEGIFEDDRLVSFSRQKP